LKEIKMFQTGDLLWIPQGSVMLSPTPSAPLAFKYVEEPSIGLYVENAEDKDFSFVLIDGERWVIKSKHIKHYRRKNVSKTN
tara:strand:- start:217 stop:462 length:246 start_codon:yes stop_codon:yes gene_type:complete